MLEDSVPSPACQQTGNTFQPGEKICLKRDHSANHMKAPWANKGPALGIEAGSNSHQSLASTPLLFSETAFL